MVMYDARTAAYKWPKKYHKKNTKSDLIWLLFRDLNVLFYLFWGLFAVQIAKYPANISELSNTLSMESVTAQFYNNPLPHLSVEYEHYGTIADQ